MYLISKRPGFFSSLLNKVTGTIGEVISIFPSDNNYHVSCPLRIKVMDKKYTRNLEKFSKAYGAKTNSDVELIIDERRMSTRFLE